MRKCASVDLETNVIDVEGGNLGIQLQIMKNVRFCIRTRVYHWKFHDY